MLLLSGEKQEELNRVQSWENRTQTCAWNRIKFPGKIISEKELSNDDVPLICFRMTEGTNEPKECITLLGCSVSESNEPKEK
jgi:hypothetical protein